MNRYLSLKSYSCLLNIKYILEDKIHNAEGNVNTYFAFLIFVFTY